MNNEAWLSDPWRESEWLRMMVSQKSNRREWKHIYLSAPNHTVQYNTVQYNTVQYIIIQYAVTINHSMTTESCSNPNQSNQSNPTRNRHSILIHPQQNERKQTTSA